MTVQQILTAGVCLLALVASQTTSTSQNWRFNVVYIPPTIPCVTCDSSGSVVQGAATYLCLQFAGNDCPTGQEDNTAACVGVCNDDDDDDGGGTVLPPPPAVTANPTLAPTTTNPTDISETFSPSAATPLPTPYPTPPPPESCGILETCNCTGRRVTAETATMDVTCPGGGFNDANGTESQTLRNVTDGECSLSFTNIINITTATGVTPVEISTCYTDGSKIEAPVPEEECKDNTGVLVIIIICVLLLLVVIGIGIYYIVHTTNAHTQVPKLVANNAI